MQSIDSNTLSDNQYENNISDIINNKIDKILLHFDLNDSHLHNKSLYYTQNQFIHDFQNISKNDLNFMHFNIRSLNKNFEQLNLLLDNIEINNFVIGLTETWFQDQPHSYYSLSHHNLIFNNRVAKRGGGVAMYVPDHFTFNVLDDINLMNQGMESVFIEIILEKRKNVIVGTVYRPPSSNQNEFLVEIQHLLSHPLFQNKHCIIMGDFNIDLLKCNDNHFSHDFLDTLLSFSFVPVILKPTRLSSHSSTLIDNIFVNVDHLKIDSGIVLSDISDHCPVYCRIQSFFDTTKLPPPVKMIRKFTIPKINKLKQKLELVNWSEVLVQNDVNTSYTKFIDVLKNALDECIPLERCKFDSYKHEPRNPWISKSLLKSINRKNNMYYKFRANPTPKRRDKYNKYKNILTRILRVEKRKYFSLQFEKNKFNIKETWRIINNALNRNSNSKRLTQIKVGDRITTNKETIANHFNDYFSNIGPTLAKNVPTVEKPFYSFLENKNQCSLFLMPTNSLEIMKIVKGFKDNRSTGNDDVSNHLLKYIIHEIIVPLEHIFNLSLVQGVVPDLIKIAKVVPIFKKR